jgi:hypothetical protein
MEATTSLTRGAWHGLKVEMQIRSELQHQWATAVEAAGTLLDQLLKSRRGDAAWLRIFTLIATAFAAKEGAPPVPGTPTSMKELCEELRHLDQETHFVSTLSAYATIIPKIQSHKRLSMASHYVLALDPVKRVTDVYPFGKNQLKDAGEFTAKLEQELPRPTQVLLVAVSSIKALKRAYPNYFLDTSSFLTEVRSMIRRPSLAAKVSNNLRG